LKKNYTTFFTVLFLLCFITLAAQDVTWDGSKNNDWADGDNWSTGSVPTILQTVLIPSGLTNYPTASAAVSVSTLTMQSGTSLIAKAGVSANGASPKFTYIRNLATTNWYLVSPPFIGETIPNVIGNHTFDTGSGSNIGFASYVLIDNSWSYYTINSFGLMSNSEGYSVKLASAGDLTLEGSIMVSTDINFNYDIEGGPFYDLIGNPYLSYIAANSNADATNNILTVNSENLEEPSLWLWNQSTNSYDVYTNDSDALYISPAQGFFWQLSND